MSVLAWKVEEGSNRRAIDGWWLLGWGRVSFILIYYYIISVSGCFTCMYACVPHVCLVFVGQKRESVPLELELQMVVSHHMSIGN